MNKLLKQAFTLIELLVVIAIIGILSGLIIISMNGTINSANDVKRKAGIDTLRKALMYYGALNGKTYPVQTTLCNVGPIGIPNRCTILANALLDSLPILPTDPVSGYYTYISDGTDFTVSAVLSNSNFYSSSSSSGFTSAVGTSCLAILNAGKSTGNGIYLINPAGIPVQVYCDMTSYGGGWTLVTKISPNDQNQYYTTANNVSDLAIAPSTAAPSRSSKLSDVDMDALISPGSIRWVIVGDNAAFYRCTGSWTSNFGATTSCSYTTSYYDAIATPSSSPTWLSFTLYGGACGGGQYSSAWGTLSGIHTGDGVYLGGYSGSSSLVQNQALAAYTVSGYANNDSWTYPGYVFVR